MSVAALLLAMVITPTSGLAATSRASAQISGIEPDEPVVDGAHCFEWYDRRPLGNGVRASSEMEDERCAANYVSSCSS